MYSTYITKCPTLYGRIKGEKLGRGDGDMYEMPSGCDASSFDEACCCDQKAKQNPTGEGRVEYGLGSRGQCDV